MSETDQKFNRASLHLSKWSGKRREKKTAKSRSSVNRWDAGCWSRFQIRIQAFNILNCKQGRGAFRPWRSEQMDKLSVFFTPLSMLSHVRVLYFLFLTRLFALCFSDKRFSALGFGARIPPNYEVSTTDFICAASL